MTLVLSEIIKTSVITASFEIEKLKNIIEWLKENDLIDDMNCILEELYTLMVNQNHILMITLLH